MKNELGGSATQQGLKGWELGGLRSQWTEKGNGVRGLHPSNPVNSNPVNKHG